jgi:hypothetical protein
MAEASSTTHDPDLSIGLVGRCFHVFDENRKVKSQGVVVAPVGTSHFLVQYFDRIIGSPSTMAVVAIDDMARPTRKSREHGTWQFYADAAHMNDWYEHHRQRTPEHTANEINDEIPEDIEF